MVLWAEELEVAQGVLATVEGGALASRTSVVFVAHRLDAVELEVLGSCAAHPVADVAKFCSEF